MSTFTCSLMLSLCMPFFALSVAVARDVVVDIFFLYLLFLFFIVSTTWFHWHRFLYCAFEWKIWNRVCIWCFNVVYTSFRFSLQFRRVFSWFLLSTPIFFALLFLYVFSCTRSKVVSRFFTPVFFYFSSICCLHCWCFAFLNSYDVGITTNVLKFNRI